MPLIATELVPTWDMKGLLGDLTHSLRSGSEGSAGVARACCWKKLPTSGTKVPAAESDRRERTAAGEEQEGQQRCRKAAAGEEIALYRMINSERLK